MLRQGVNRTYHEWRRWKHATNWVLKSPTTAIFILEREFFKLEVDVTATTLSGALIEGFTIFWG